jgi:acetyltransferase-like isoleucine patch superfamily enzyme
MSILGGGAYIWAIGGLEIGDNTILGPRVTIHTSNHRYYNAEYLPYDNYSYLESVKIGRNVWIGDSAMICPGVKIGDGAVIAMGSVVGGDVPNLAVVAGNPARVIKYRNKEKYEYLDNQKKYYLLEKTNNTNFKHIYIRKS